MTQPATKQLNSLEQSKVGAPKHYSGTLSIKSGNTVSDPVMVPSGITRVACGVVLVSSSSAGRVEYTLSPIEVVALDQANWRAWPDGDVTVNTDGLLLCPVTALRAVCTSGALTYEFVGG